jgi:hypothetical protein
MASILSGTQFDASVDTTYTKPKVNASGGKQIGILNKQNMKTLYISTPLMLTWGVNEYVDERSGKKTYDMALQFPNDEYNNQDCVEFLKNMQKLEQKLKDDAITFSKEWLNKTKMVPEAIDALWTSMLKYPRDKNTDEPDYSRAPTLKVKIPYWEGEFKNVELYNEKQELVFPPMEESNEDNISNYIVKASNVATIIQCGGLWVANGKFGVTWKLFQAVVKPRTTLSGRCHIVLSQEEKEKIAKSVSEDTKEVVNQEFDVQDSVVVADSDDENVNHEQAQAEAQAEVQAEVESKKVVTEDVPKKKKVVKKKTTVSTDES